MLTPNGFFTVTASSLKTLITTLCRACLRPICRQRLLYSTIFMHSSSLQAITTARESPFAGSVPSTHFCRRWPILTSRRTPGRIGTPKDSLFRTWGNSPVGEFHIQRRILLPTIRVYRTGHRIYRPPVPGEREPLVLPWIGQGCRSWCPPSAVPLLCRPPFPQILP